MKRTKILSSESDASIKVKQRQNTDIDLHIKPPAQTVNFQPSAMADLATMARPIQPPKPSTFTPIMEEEPLIRSITPSKEYMESVLAHHAFHNIKQAHASATEDGLSVQESQPITPSQSLHQEQHQEDTVKPPQERKVDNAISNNELPVLRDRGISPSELPTLRNHFRSHELLRPKEVSKPITEKEINLDDLSIVDELKRPEEILPNQPSIKHEQERERLEVALMEKTRRANILESLLGIYENKHQIINRQVTCKQRQLEQLVRAYCNADEVEILFEPLDCGCILSAPKMLDIESILVTKNGKTIDFKYGYNDAYADLVRHGINLKQAMI